MSEFRVLKFGGTSVANAEAMKRVEKIVNASDTPGVVVLSATAGTTDELIRIIHLAAHNQLKEALATIEQLLERHMRLCRELNLNEEEILVEMKVVSDNLTSVVKGIYYLGEVTPKAFDSILASGEVLSSAIFSAFYGKSHPCRLVDARDFMVTDNGHQKAIPNQPQLQKKVGQIILPLLKNGLTVVTQGFIGKSDTGETTTLGRGGSDYTASLIGMALPASQIEIWTDVSGVYTADPRIVPNAKPVNYLTFEEASELAYFGARVLHPSTILPAMRKHIPVLVKNTHKPHDSGTQITRNGIHEGRVQAIAFKKKITMVTIESTRMLLAHGFLEKLFSVFSTYETAVDLISTSEISVSLTIDDTTHLPSIQAELQQFATVSSRSDMAMIALVGNRIRERQGFLHETFSVLKHIPVEMVSFGGSNINLSLIVPQIHFQSAVRALHAHFFEGENHG